ncbi:hypothetical protein [Halomonas salinarum]|uniref:hypothetical protein n=1 Tax=Halomonas salinarum TaxID=1158993 RepID=UPI00143A189C|nr:hypothetical protein [Halomonas salinarum]
MKKETPEEREYRRLRDEINGVTLARLLFVFFAIRHAVTGDWIEAVILLVLAYLLRIFLPVTR